MQLAGGLAVGTYRLANYTGELAGSLTLPNVGRSTLSLQADTSTSPKHLDLVVLGNPYSLLWTGATGSAWDVAGSFNWLNQLSNPDQFQPNDSVLFNDQSANPSVTLDVTVQPGNVVVSNNANAYTFSGAGNITGPGGLTKQGSGTLTLSNTNDFTGLVTISGGLLILGNTNALGATNGVATIASGGTLELNAQPLDGKVVHAQGAGYDGNGAIVNNGTNGAGWYNSMRYLALDGPTTLGANSRWDVRGTGPLGSAWIQGGSYPVTKTGSNTFGLTVGCDVTMGDLLIAAGNVAFESASTMNPGFGITINDSARMSLYLLSTPLGRNVTLQNNGRLCATLGATNQNIVSGSVTLNGLGYVDATGTGIYLTLAGPVTGSGSLCKVDPGTVILTSLSNNWGSGTVVSNGTLQVGDGVSNGSLPGTGLVSNYATLLFKPGTSFAPPSEITGPGTLSKIGNGTLVLGISNSFTGPVTTGNGDVNTGSGGIVRLLNRYGFGDPSISKTVSVVRTELHLEGGMDIPNTVTLHDQRQLLPRRLRGHLRAGAQCCRNEYCGRPGYFDSRRRRLGVFLRCRAADFQWFDDARQQRRTFGGLRRCGRRRGQRPDR